MVILSKSPLIIEVVGIGVGQHRAHAVVGGQQEESRDSHRVEEHHLPMGTDQLHRSPIGEEIRTNTIQLVLLNGFCHSHRRDSKSNQ